MPLPADPLQPDADDVPPSRLETMRRMIEEISGELELEPLLGRIVGNACRLVGADDGTIALLDRGRNVLRTAAVYRMPDGELGTEMGPGIGLAGHVLATGQPVLARYGDLARITRPELADNSVIGVPIHWQDELIGVFGVGAAAPRALHDGDVDMLSLFARHAGIAIENARRYQRERRRLARFELIVKVARIIGAGLSLDALLQQAADAVHDVLEYPSVDIPLLDPASRRHLVVRVRGGAYKRMIRGEDRIPIDRGIMGAAVRERRSQRVNDVRGDPRYVQPPVHTPAGAELAVPIVLGREVLGVLNVEGDGPFDELDQTTLETVADHLAIAIQNARLAEQAQAAAVMEERQRLARELHDSVTQILSSISLLAQALPAAWRNNAQDGERRAHRLAELSQTAFAEMRALLRELLPPGSRRTDISREGRSFLGLEQLKAGGLAAALPRLLGAMVPEALRYDLDSAGYVPQQVAHEEALYRVCQEAVSNSIRHAGARRIEVAISVDAQEASLRIRDDGRGLASNHLPGIGLQSMRQRVLGLGGRFELVPRLPGGLEVRAHLPRRDRSLTPDPTPDRAAP